MTLTTTSPPSPVNQRKSMTLQLSMVSYNKTNKKNLHPNSLKNDVQLKKIF